MKTTLSSLADKLGLELVGEDREISGVNTLDKAGPHELSFLANPKYAPLLASTRAGAVLLGKEFAGRFPTVLLSGNPYFDFVRVVQMFDRPQGCMEGVAETSFVHPEADVARDCVLYPGTFVGARAVVGRGTKLFPGCYIGEDCRVGENCLLYPNVTLMAGTLVGDRVTLHAGVVLGSDGFGFALGQGGREKFPQIGRVVVEDDVEIGANSTVDRAALAETRIGAGTKIDNLVQVGHNVTIGKNCTIVALAGIAGSAKLGDNVTLAGQVGVSGHLTIGDGATVGPKSGVAKDIPAGAVVGGQPAMDRGTFMRTLAIIPKLPELARRVARLEKQLAEGGLRPGKGEDNG